MYAIVENGGKQYKVEKDQVLSIEYDKSAEVGSEIALDCIMVPDGEKIVAGDKAGKATVKAQVVSHGKGDKIIVFKYKAKKNIRKKQGHRQPFTKIKVTEISVK